MADGQEMTPEEYFQQKREQAAQAARQSAFIVSQPLTKSPDEYAQAARMAKSVNLPTAVIEPNFKTFAQKMNEKRNEMILGSAPILAQWVAAEDNYKIAADDVEGLSWWEQLAIVPRGIASAIPAVNEGAWGFVAGAAGLFGDNAVGRYAQTASRQQRQAKTDWAGPTGGWLGRQVQGASQSIGTMLPGIAATIATGGAAVPAVAAAYVLPGAISQGGQSTQKALDKGLSAPRALGYGLLDASAEALLERVPVGRLLGDIAKGSGVMRTVGRNVALEVPTEVATTLFQNFNEWATINPEKPFKEFIAEQPEAIRDTVAQTILAAGAVSGTASGIGKYVQGKEQARAADERKAMFEAMSGAAMSSKLRERMPTKFREYVDDALANGPIDSVYVPAKEFTEYFQSQGVDPFELTDELGMSRDDLDAALAGGGDLRVPTSAYAAHIAGTDADAFFMDHMKLSPDEMSAREAAEFNERAQDAMQEAWEEAERIRVQEEALRGAEERIFDTMQSRLRQAGRTTDVANTEALLYPAFYRVMAQRSGMSTEAFLETYPLPQVEGVRPEGMQTKDVSEFNRFLAEARSRKAPAKATRGSSLLEFIHDYGGINDVGGELRSRDAQIIKRGKGKKNLVLHRGAREVTKSRAGAKSREIVVEDGSAQGSMMEAAARGRSHSVDDVALAVVESGFLANHPAVIEYRNAMESGGPVPDLVGPLFEAIDEELRGEAQYADDGDVVAQGRDTAMDQLEEYLASIGVSLDENDDAIMRAVRRDEDEGRRYAQDSGKPIRQKDGTYLWRGETFAAKPPKRLYRGIVEGEQESGEAGYGTAFLGQGLYSSPTKSFAKMYAVKRVNGSLVQTNNVVEIDPFAAFPRKPLVLHGQGGGPQVFMNWVYQTSDFKRAADFNRAYPDPAAFVREMGYDGVVVGDEVVRYPPAEGGRFLYQSEAGRGDRELVSNTYKFAPYHSAKLSQDTGTGPRGSIQFPVAGVQGGEAIIRLAERADLSTFLHETGHYFLTVMQDMAQVDPSTAGEFDAVKGWWRENAGEVAKDARKAFPELAITAEQVQAAIDTGTSGDAAVDQAIDVGMQEQWARGFEQYVMEGKAPSAELRGAFERFRAWLLSVYRNLAGLNVNISNDLRRVFDRMLATDEEIAQATDSAGGSSPLFATAEEMGLTPEEFDRFQKLRAQAEDEAKGRLLKETMAPIKREREKWYRDERAIVRETVEREINAYRQYRAIEWMGNRRWLGEDQPSDIPDIRLSKDILVKRYGGGILKTLPRGKQTVYTVEGGVDPDEAAGWFGYNSGDEMLRAMETATPRKQAIDAETDKRMYDAHGDVLNDGSAQEKALEAVHGEKRSRVLALELDALNRKLGNDQPTRARQIREIARRTISRMKVRDAMAANRFLAAERKAARDAYRAVAEGDIETAATAKYRQLLNHSLYSEAVVVAEEVAKAERFVAGLSRSSKREKIAGAGRRENAQIDYLGAIDDILEQYDFRRMSGRAEERRGALLAFVEAMKAAGRENELSIPDAVLENAARTPYKTIPVEQLRGVVDSLKNLEHVALRWNDLIDAQRKRDLDATVTDIVGAIDANLPKRPPGPVKTRGEKARNTVRAYFDSVLNATTLLREIDGFEDRGAAYQGLKAPIDEAQDRLTVRKQDASTRLEALYDVYTKEERRAMAVRTFMPELGFAISKWEKIALALNTGNEGNLDRLMSKGARRSFTEGQITSVLQSLDKRDADFVQSVWDFVGSYKADIAARERRVTGVEPAWVDPSPVVIGGKELRGGYYPIKYDHRLSPEAADRETQELANSLMAGRFGKAQTKNGHTKERASGSSGSIDLDMMVLHKHVNQVVYDLEMSEPVSNAWRVLQDARTRAALDNAGRSADFDALQSWLKDSAEGELGATSQVGAVLRGLKSNFTAAKLAFNISNALLQIAGTAQSFVVVGKKDMALGILKTARNPMEAARMAAEASPFMASRQTTFNKDVMDFYSDASAGAASSRISDFKRNVWGPASFWLMQKLQWHFADVPTWVAGFDQGLRKFEGDEAKAIAHADGLVKRAQASGLFIDRSGIERGSLSSQNRQNDVVKLFTTLGSYMFAKFNVAYERSAVASRTMREEGVSVRSAQEALSWTIDMVFLFTLEALVTAAIKGGLPSGDDGEDKDGWAAWLAKKTATSVLGTLPFIRDGVSALEGFSGGGAYGSVIEDTAKAITSSAKVTASAATGEDIKKSDVKRIINGTGVATGAPTVFINRIVDAGWRQSEGEDVSPLEYIFGAPPKK